MAEADGLGHGEKGAWLRRKGLYAGELSNWRKELAEPGEAGLAARKPGRKASDARDKEIERLKKANARLPGGISTNTLSIESKQESWLA